MTEPETTVQTGYDYAGFLYTVVRSADGLMRAIPDVGQHAAASKPKHCMAAIACWQQDQAALAARQAQRRPA
jgi:hypothetical protein